MTKYLLHTLVAIISCSTMALHLSASDESQINAGDFGLQDIASGDDTTPIFRRAIEACRERGISSLVIPPGEWHLYPDHAFEKNVAVANNDSGVKRIVFLLDDTEGFTLFGQGAKLICHGQMIPISADGADKLTLKGFSIDWHRPFNLQARVIAVHPEVNAFDLQIHDEVIYELRGSRLIFREKPSLTPQAWKEWAPTTSEQVVWEHNLQWNMWFEGDTGHPVPGEHQWAMEPDPRVEELQSGVIRVFDSTKIMPRVGWVLTVNGMGHPNRTSPAIRIASSQDLQIEDVTIHHAGGMGVIVQRTNNASLRRMRVMLPPDKQRLVTTTADATHFNGCRGEILLEDCLFENMLDDATNVHGCFVQVQRQVGPKTFLCRRMHSQQRGLIVATAGDRVRFVNNLDLQSYCDALVKSTRELNSDLFEITLDELPEKRLPLPLGLYNLTWQPNFTVRRCTVQNNRARSMLVATAGEVLIEDNHFAYSSMAGIQFEGENSFWWESGPTQNVMIRRNLFRNNAGQVLRIAPLIDSERFPDSLYHGGIHFEDNLIQATHRRIIEGIAVDGLVFRGNKIQLDEVAGEQDLSAPSFVFRSGRNIVFENNKFNGAPPLTVVASTPSARPKLIQSLGIEFRDESSTSD